MDKLKLFRFSFENLIALIFALRGITFIWLAFASPDYMPLYADIVFVLRYCTILLGPLYLYIKHDVIKNISIIIPVVFYWLMLVFNTYGGYEGSYIHELVSISCFLLMKKEMKVRVFLYFYNIIIFCCAFSVLLFVGFGIGLPIGYEIVPFVNDGVETSVYVKWTIFAIVGDGSYGLPRLCSIFNEPGGLGTLCGLLYAVTYTFSTKFEKIVLVITAILTFSMAGYILFLLFYAILFVKKGPKFYVPLIMLVVFFLCAPYIDWGDDYVNSFAERFKFTDEGLEGDDRVNDSFNALYRDFLNSSDVFFGRGATFGGDMGASSYKNLIIQFGYVGFGIYFLVWLLFALRASKWNRACIIALIVFVVSIYQRPVTVTNAYGYILIFGGFCAVQWLRCSVHNKVTTTKIAPTKEHL